MKGLGNDAPLDRRVLRAVPGVDGLVAGPTDRAVIDDDVVRIPISTGVDTQAVVLLLRFRAAADADVSQDHVLRRNPHLIFPETNAIARRGLAGDGDVGVLDHQVAVERDRAGNAEDDDARAGRIAGVAQAAGSGVVEVCDLDDLPPAPAGRG